MPVPKPTKSDLVPKYMTEEVHTIGRDYIRLYLAARHHYTNADSLALAMAMNWVTAKYKISESEVLEAFSQFIVASWDYGSRNYHP